MKRNKILIISLLMIVLLSGLVISIFPISGVINYYNFNEDSGNLLDIIGLKNGELIDSVGYPITRGSAIPGIINNAYNFSATSNGISGSYINFTTPSQECYDLLCSISVWVNFSSAGARTLYWQGNASLNEPSLAIEINNGNLTVTLIDGSLTTTTVGGITNNYNNGLWNNFIFTLNSSSLNVYVNGTLTRNRVHSSSAFNNSEPIEYIGGRPSTSSSAPTDFYQGRVDEFVIWNRELTSTEVSDIWNSGIGAGFVKLVSLITPLNNSFISSSEQTFNASMFSNSSITNATFYMWNTTGSVVNQTNITITGLTNYSVFNITGIPFGKNYWNVLSCDAVSCIFANNNFTLNTGIFVNSNLYNLTTAVGQVETFQTNVSAFSTPALSSARLNWNGTYYLGSISGIGGNDKLLSRTITIPNVTGNISWFWEVNFGSDGQFNLTSNSQQVTSLGIDDCSSNAQQILNFTLYDEDLRTTKLNGTIELLVNLWNSQRTTISSSFNQSYDINPYGTTAQRSARVCIGSLNTTLSMDYQTKYFGNVSIYEVEYKFAQAISVTNTTAVQNVDLYSLLQTRSTPFTIILQSADLSLIKDAVIDIQRQYIPINQFLSVESPITNNVGEAIGHLVHNEIYYNFVVSQNGTLIGTFNNYIVQCQNFVTGDCRIILNLISASPKLPNFKDYGNITGALNFTLATRDLRFDFVSSDGLVHNVSWNVLKLDNFGNNTVCLDEISATSGTLNCNIPQSFGNSSIYVKLYSDSNFIGSSIFSLQLNAESIFGGTKVILGMLMYTTLTLMMIAHPVTIIIGAVLGMFFAGFFGVVDGGTLGGTSLIILWFVVAGVIIIHYITKRSKT